MDNDDKKRLASVLGLAWMFAVLAAYYYFNQDYYMLKISVFGDYLGRFLP